MLFDKSSFEATVQIIFCEANHGIWCMVIESKNINKNHIINRSQQVTASSLSKLPNKS